MEREQQPGPPPPLRIEPLVRRRIAIVLFVVSGILLAVWIAAAMRGHHLYLSGLLGIIAMLLGATSVAVGGARKPPRRR